MEQDKLPPEQQALQMMMGLWISQTMGVLARLELPDRIGEGSATSDELAKSANANPDAVHRLLRAAASIGLLEQIEPRRFKLTPVGACLRSNVRGSLRDLVIAESAPGHWLPWGQLHEAVKTGKPRTRDTLGTDAWTYYAKHPDEAAYFARGMSNVSALASADVIAAYDFSRFEEIADVGGSQGMLLSAILEAAPKARGILFDRPEVIEAGKSAVARYTSASRIRAVAGDFLESVPAGADAYILKSIVHDWDDEPCARILSNVARAAKDSAKLLIVEMVVPEQRVPPPTALMDLNMLVMLGGRERTAEEFRALLARAGWKLDRIVPTRGFFSVIEAVKNR